MKYIELEEAIKIAIRKNDKRNFRIACAILRADGVLVISSNCANTGKAPSHHAEARAAKKATPYSYAYVVRVTKNNTLANARPCDSCMLKLKAVGVISVFYTNQNGNISNEILNR